MDRTHKQYSTEFRQGFEDGYSSSLVNSITTNTAGATCILALPIPVNTTLAWKVTVVARQISGAAGTVGDSACFLASQGLAVNNAGTSSSIGATASPAAVTYSSAAAAAWTITFSVDNTTDCLLINGIGEVNKNIDWTARIEFVDVA